MNNIRIDDIGSSAKFYAKHIKYRSNLFGKDLPIPKLFNIGSLRTSKLLRGWAIYEELKPAEWDNIFEVLDAYSLIPIIAITACWVDRESRLIPFPQKFRDEAEWLKQRLKERKIVIANHGLTHCVLGKEQPKFWGSNQFFWREFYSFLDESVHDEHILLSQEILEEFFEEPVTIFVPPGNVWSRATYKALKKSNIKTVLANRYMSDSNEKMEGIEFVDDKNGILNIHDRELKMFGHEWLKEQLEGIGQKGCENL